MARYPDDHPASGRGSTARRRWLRGLWTLLAIGALAGGVLAAGRAIPDAQRPSFADPPPATARASAGPGTTPPVRPKPTQPAAAPQITLAFAGDVHFEGRVVDRLDEPASALGPVASVPRRADLAMVNLETAITVRGTPEPKQFRFRAPPVAFDALRSAGVDVATMANNHGVDYGQVGLDDSLAASQVRDRTLSAWTADDTSPGIASAYSERLIAAVKAARRTAEVVVVYLHWGVEGQECPSADQQQLAGALAQAGADAVVGTHAHLLLGGGFLGSTYVAYGLGNFLWWRNDAFSNDTGVLTLTFRGRRVTASTFTPAHIDNRGVPVPTTGADSTRVSATWDRVRGCAGLSTRPGE